MLHPADCEIGCTSKLYWRCLPIVIAYSHVSDTFWFILFSFYCTWSHLMVKVVGCPTSQMLIRHDESCSTFEAKYIIGSWNYSHLRPWSCCMMDHLKEASSVISALSINALMRNISLVRQCIDGQSGDYALTTKPFKRRWKRKLPSNTGKSFDITKAIFQESVSDAGFWYTNHNLPNNISKLAQSVECPCFSLNVRFQTSAEPLRGERGP